MITKDVSKRDNIILTNSRDRDGLLFGVAARNAMKSSCLPPCFPRHTHSSCRNKLAAFTTFSSAIADKIRPICLYLCFGSGLRHYSAASANTNVKPNLCSASHRKICVGLRCRSAPSCFRSRDWRRAFRGRFRSSGFPTLLDLT